MADAETKPQVEEPAAAEPAAAVEEKQPELEAAAAVVEEAAPAPAEDPVAVAAEEKKEEEVAPVATEEQPVVAQPEEAAAGVEAPAPAAEEAKAADVEQGKLEKPNPAAGEPAAAGRPAVKVGYMTFTSGQACYEYFNHIIRDYSKNQNLNEYEQFNVLELIRTGHPDASRKLADAVVGIQIRDVMYNGQPSVCFHLLRENGKTEDVSYRKCVSGLFPEMRSSLEAQNNRHKQHGRLGVRDGGGMKSSRGGGRGGRGGGGRGEGGRGGGGRGGRGRGGRGRF